MQLIICIYTECRVVWRYLMTTTAYGCSNWGISDIATVAAAERMLSASGIVQASVAWLRPTWTLQEIDIDTDGRTGDRSSCLARGTSSESATRDHCVRPTRRPVPGTPSTSPFRNCAIIGEFRRGARAFSRNVISTVSTDAHSAQFSGFRARQPSSVA